MNDSLEHYGVKGMRWGVRRTPEQLGHRNLAKSRTANFDKWGKSPSTNVLYIAGYSGSGKSTTAQALADETGKKIHLDLYFETISDSDAKDQDPEFNKWLDKKVPKWKQIANPTEMQRHSKEWWNLVDSFSAAIESYGADQYAKGNRVIAEGVQISDDVLYPNKSSYKGKPIAILGTNPVVAMTRAFDRDGRGNLLVGLSRLDNPGEYLQWYANTQSRLNDLAKSSDAKRGSKAVQDYLKKYGQRKLT